MPSNTEIPGLHPARSPPNQKHENQKISIFMTKKARTKLNLLLEVKERLPDKD
jgi:hypothetical protein